MDVRMLAPGSEVNKLSTDAPTSSAKSPLPKVELQKEASNTNGAAGRGQSQAQDVNVAKSSSKKRKRTDGKAKKSVAAQKKKKDIGLEQRALAKFVFAELTKKEYRQSESLTQAVNFIFRKLSKRKPKVGSSTKVDLFALDVQSLKVILELLKSPRKQAYGTRQSSQAKKTSSIADATAQRKVAKRKANATAVVKPDATKHSESANLPSPSQSQASDLFCICHRKYQGGAMVECASPLKRRRCNSWVHVECFNLQLAEIEKVEKYICPMCRHSMRGYEMDYQVRPTTKPKPKNCVFCSLPQKRVPKCIQERVGPFIYDDTMETFWIHKYCGFSSKSIGMNQQKQWHNVAKTARKSKAWNCSSTACVAGAKHGATIKCKTSGCRNRTHLVCCEDTMRRLRQLPTLKSKEPKVQAVAEQQLRKARTRIIAVASRNWLCARCLNS